MTSMAANKKKFIQLGVGLTISVICLWLALRSVPFEELGRVLSEANYLWLIPMLISIIISTVVRAQRWRVLLGQRVNLTGAFWAYTVGYAFTNIFPFRLGEPARIVVLSARRKLPLVEVAATVGVERLLDIIAVLFILLGVLPFMTVPIEVKQTGLLFGAIAVVGLIIIFSLVKLGPWSETLLRRLVSRFLPRYADAIVARWVELVRGLSVLTRPSVGIPAVGWSILAWLTSLSFQWFVLLAFQSRAGLVEAAFMVATLSLAIAVPAGPGFIGVYQWVGQQSLVIPFPNLYTTTRALGVAITAHLAYYISTTSLGVAGLWYFGQSFMGLRQRLSQAENPVEASQKI
jgi:hypothetical protein